MDFVEVLGRAWKIVWKHKVLWIFGILAGCARGGGGGGTGGGSGWRQERPFSQDIPPEIQQYLTTAGDWIANHLWLVLALVLLFLVVIVLAIFLGTVGRIGLIRGTMKADGGAERLGFGELFQESLPFFWRVFGLSVLLGLAFLVIVGPFIAAGVLTAGVGFLCLVPLLCILIPVFIVAGVVVAQANVAMVTENLGLMDGLRRGWTVFKKNLGPLMLVWLILAIIGFVAGLVIALPVLMAAIPAYVAFRASGGHSSPVLIAGGVCFAVYLPILLVANGILTAYLESVWTLAYLRLTLPRESKESSPVLPSNA
jgi:membrane-anchored glycerophosphoryl diester phosphodiesterase (GDPDase)